ncbi:MAG: hypothetical protein LAO24_00045 [Acidobacteriia bacterium]|nr:hypothetical protein [Terriglobia bacterium]
MARAVDGVSSDLEQLTERVQDLERRVAALETQREPGAPAESRATAAVEEPPTLSVPSGAVPVLGKAVLGIAGAYLLRAVAESGSIPKLPVLVVAILYAGMWLVWAARIHAANRFASTTYGITAALILAPMLWESTVQFQVLAPVFTAVVLAGFVVLALGLSWRHNLQAIPWVATLAAVITALALIIATRELVPFTAALLVLALATEVVVQEGHRLSLRAVPAIAADFTVWLLVYVMTGSEGVPVGYRAANPGTVAGISLALLAIYGGSIAIRNLAFLSRITSFEVAQGMIVFVLAVFASLRAAHGYWELVLGAFFLATSAVCYWGALWRFASDTHNRNRRAYATYAAALLLAGSFMVFPANLQAPLLSLAAVAACFGYLRHGSFSLGIHGSIFLVAAAIASGFLTYAGSALAGTVPLAPDWQEWTVAAAAALCYGVGSRGSTDQRRRRLLWVIPAALAALAGAALAVVAVVSLSSGRIALSASSIAMTRTLVLCALALIFAFAASRFERPELGWLAYATIACGTAKLLFEDLRLGNAASLVVSLLFYGLVLILMPRILTRK